MRTLWNAPSFLFYERTAKYSITVKHDKILQI